MRTFSQLIAPEQAAAVEYCLTELLRAILEGGLRFNDAKNGDDLQARIDKAVAEAKRMQTPWFTGEYIIEAAGEDLRAMAQCGAEDTSYADKDDGPIVRLTGTVKDSFKVTAI